MHSSLVVFPFWLMALRFQLGSADARVANLHLRLTPLRTPIGLLLLFAIAAIACHHTNRYMAPGVKLEEATYPEGYRKRPISASQAVDFAVRSLKSRRVTNIQICDLDWIVAPLGGAIVSAVGCLEKDGIRFEVFQLGLRDGTEVQYGHPPGEEFFFAARGVDRSGQVVFDPPLTADELTLLVYEFASTERMNQIARAYGRPCR